jgi:hypothetical protein
MAQSRSPPVQPPEGFLLLQLKLMHYRVCAYARVLVNDARRTGGRCTAEASSATLDNVILPAHDSVMRRIGALALAIVLSSCATSPPPSPSARPDLSNLPSPSPTQAVPPGTSACTTAQVLIQHSWAGATGSLAGGVEVTNLGSSACALTGPPHVELRADGGPLAVTITTYRSVNADQPSEAPPVLLGPGAQAQAPMVWSNWCGGPLTKIVVIVRLPDGSGPVLASYVGPGGQDGETPRCDAPGAGSSLDVFPFQPRS